MDMLWSRLPSVEYDEVRGEEEEALLATSRGINADKDI